MISAFLSNGRVIVNYTVSENGEEKDCRMVFNWAVQDGHRKQLSENELRNLHLAVNELPEKNVLPSLERLIIVSFRQNDNWITRSYDRNNLPQAMRKIYDIVGERFETRQKQR